MQGLSLSIHPSYHLRERRLHSHRVRSHETEGESGATGVPQVAQCRHAHASRANRRRRHDPSHLTISPVPRGKSLRNQNTPASSTSRQTRGDRRRHKTDSRTQLLSLAAREHESRADIVRRTRVSRACFFLFFFFLFFLFLSLFFAPRNFSEAAPLARESFREKTPTTDHAQDGKDQSSRLGTKNIS